MMPIYK